jgi:hypothetical protein
MLGNQDLSLLGIPLAVPVHPPASVSHGQVVPQFLEQHIYREWTNMSWVFREPEGICIPCITSP